MEPLQIIDYGTVAVTLFFFALGSFFDLKTREVSNKVWVVYGLCGSALTITRLYVDPPALLLTLVSIAITTGVSLALFYLGLFGGADAKAIICLALAIPLFPASFPAFIGYVHPFFPIVVLVLGFICSVSVAIWLGTRNLVSLIGQGFRIFNGLEHESSWRKSLAFITGYPTNITKLTSTFYLYPMEQVVIDGAEEPYRKFHFFFDAETDRDKMVSEFINSLPKVGSPETVWVSPGLPMLVFMFIALIITLVAGDIIFRTIFMLTFH